MRTKSRSLLLIGIFFVAALACFIAFGAFAHEVREEAFQQITVGMTEPEVLTLLGKPYRVRRDTPTATAFFYGGFPRWRWCTMEVFFDSGGRVTGKFHDH